MNITIFKNAREAITGYHKSVFYALDRIKLGKSKEYVEKLRAMKIDDYQEKKKNLPAVCYCGTFNHRSSKGLIKKSGLIILDFDKFEDIKKATEFKKQLQKNEYVFLAKRSKESRIIIKIVATVNIDKLRFISCNI